MSHTNRSRTKHCEKYAEWMSDEALGALAPKHEAELLAHAAECEDCREAYQHARELAELVDRGVESLVAGEPSAHFATRLRARIAPAAEPARASWLAWRPIAAGLAMALVAAAVLVSYGPWRGKPQPPLAHVQANTAANPSRTVAASAEADVGLSTKPATNHVQAHRPPVEEGSGYRSASRGHAVLAQAISHGHVLRRGTAASEPEVIVPPGQLQAVWQLVGAIQSGWVDAKQLAAAQQGPNKPIEIKPNEIAPLAPPSDISLTGPADSSEP
jgi:predicted anti-sigma-YlaC factor YlaD